MSYAYPPQPAPGPAPAPGRRPTIVAIAATLMMIIGGLGLVHSLVTLVTTGQVVDRFRDRAAETDASDSDIDTFVNVLRGFSIGGAIIAILLSLLFIGLALGVLRGSNVSRILTWVMCGIGILCSCCGAFSLFGQVGNSSFGSGNTDDRTTEELSRAMQDAYPGWWAPIYGSLSVLELLGYIAIAVLLALPVANAFFRKPAVPPVPPWQPPPPAM